LFLQTQSFITAVIVIITDAKLRLIGTEVRPGCRAFFIARKELSAGAVLQRGY
jgi:hypothetical protein